MSQPLDRRRPLWESWLVEGLPDGRWCLISKIHHCMVDGISGVELLTVVLAGIGRAPARPAPVGSRTPAVGPGRRGRRVARPGRRPPAALRRAPSVLRDPLGSARRPVAPRDCGGSVDTCRPRRRCRSRAPSARTGVVALLGVPRRRPGSARLRWDRERRGARRARRCLPRAAARTWGRRRPRRRALPRAGLRQGRGRARPPRQPCVGPAARAPGERGRPARTPRPRPRADARAQGLAHGRGGRSHDRWAISPRRCSWGR